MYSTRLTVAAPAGMIHPYKYFRCVRYLLNSAGGRVLEMHDWGSRTLAGKYMMARFDALVESCSPSSILSRRERSPGETVRTRIARLRTDASRGDSSLWSE